MHRARRFDQGEHVCAIYATADERDALIAAYIAEGLAHGERCLYGALSQSELDSVDKHLYQAGVDVNAAVKRGAWVRLTTRETHLIGGHFDAERMLAMLNDATEAALTAGYQGFRCCGDMTWLADAPPGADEAVAYEAILNSMFERQRALGLCVYDQRSLTSEVIGHALATHRTVALAADNVANPFYRPGVVSRATAPYADDVDIDWKLRQLNQQDASF